MEKAGDPAAYCRNRIGPGKGWKSFAQGLQRTLQSRAAVWVIVCVQHFNGTILLLNSERLAEAVQVLKFQGMSASI
jgi:hypothetical protein